MTQIDVQKLVAESRFNRTHALMLFWCMLVLILDGYDLGVVGAALPAIMADLDIGPAGAGIMASSALFGMMVGAMFLGTLSDKFSRPVMICICVALFSVFTAAAGLTNDVITFSITRFIAGLGIGGALPIVAAQMSEFAPVRLRTLLVTMVFTGYSIGGIIVALTSKQLIETYSWRSVFFAAVVPVVLIPLIIKTLPDSLGYLIRKGRAQELRRIAGKLRPEYDLPSHAHFVLPAESKAQDAPIRELFKNGRGFSTLMVWVAFFTGLFMVYALSSWLTKLMAMAGYSLGSALNFVLVFNLGAMIGSILGGWLGDKLNVKYVLFGFYVTGAASLVAMGYTTSTTFLFLIIFIVGASTLGTQLLAYAYAGGFYPASIRSTGVGFASGVGRLGAITAPMLIGALVALDLTLAQNFAAIAIAGAIGAVAVLMIDHSQHSTSLQITRSAPKMEPADV